MKERMDGVSKFWIVIGVLIGILFGISLGVFMALLSYFNLKHLNVSNGDTISIANTYIVFISIIFILFTIAITIGGYVFSKIFTMEKKREIHQNIIIISNQLKHDKETRDVFIDEILNNKAIIDKITKKILEITDKIKNEELQTSTNIEERNELKNIMNERRK